MIKIAQDWDKIALQIIIYRKFIQIYFINIKFIQKMCEIIL